MAVFMMCALSGFVPAYDDQLSESGNLSNDAATYPLDAYYSTSMTLDRDYCGVKGTGNSEKIIVTLKSTSNMYYSAELKGPGDKDATSSIDYSKSNVNGSKNLNISAPDKTGDYTLKVSFYADSARTELKSEKRAVISVVDPVLLKAKLVNKSAVNMEIEIYFKVDGNKVEGSEQKVTVPAEGDKEVEYKFVTKSVSGSHTYSIDVDNNETVAGTIEGLGVEYNFYGYQTSYSWMLWLAAIGVVVMFLIMLSVYRKPVKNLGKPKSRR